MYNRGSGCEKLAKAGALQPIELLDLHHGYLASSPDGLDKKPSIQARF